MATQAELKNLAIEIDTDPLVRGYSGMTDQQAADDLNTEYRSTNRNTFTGVYLFGLADRVEYAGMLADSDKGKARAWHEMTLLNIQEIDITEANYLELVRYAFGSNSNTETELLGARPQDITRAEELTKIEGKPVPIPVLAGHVADARRLLGAQTKGR